jgi:4-oxalomesaconate tautomerase
MQTAIPYMHLRGGSSKGLYFNAKDLPTDEATRNKILLAAIEGSDVGDARQIDGLGGGSSLSSKVAIVSPSNTEGVDLDYYFIQVMIGKGKVSKTQTCGNILAGVLPFAIESGMIEATHPTTSAKISIVNTGGICEVVVETPNFHVNYAGNTTIDGVVGTSAPIICNYLDTEGSTCGSLLPTGNAIDIIDGKEVTCIDNGMPLVVLRASDFNISGYETKEILDANKELKKQIEHIRLQAGIKMNLGDVEHQSIPKMCLVSTPSVKERLINTRMFIPHVCHDAIGVLAAVSVATACLLPNTVPEGLTQFPAQNKEGYSVEHPSGEFTVNLESSFRQGILKISKSGVIRTARLLSKGVVFIPSSLYNGS